MYMLPCFTEIAMLRPMLPGNRVSPPSSSLSPTGINLLRPLAASLFGLLLGLWPAALRAGSKIEPAPQRTTHREAPGALVIVGGGSTPDAVRRRFVELAGGGK